jgi:hypothetical protein
MQTAAPTAWGRLGYVLNWAGIVAGLLLAAFMAVVLTPPQIATHARCAGAGARQPLTR